MHLPNVQAPCRHALAGPIALGALDTAPGTARRWADAVLRHEWGISEDMAGAVTLVLSELATNGVRAARDFPSPGMEPFICVQLMCHSQSGSVRVTVWDTGQGQPVVRRASRDEVSGRGLQLVWALSNGSLRWGPVQEQGFQGKAVWAVISCGAHDV
jgi:anti-sigma regulatory factor (Ser/Thr protein kinase)